MRSAGFAILCLLIFTALAGYADNVRWHVVRTEHFMVYYAEDRLVAEKAGSLAEKWHGALSDKLGFEPDEVIPIYLYPDRPSFSQATGVGRADPVVGLAHTRTNVVRVDASGAFGDIAGVIPHELVHVFISDYLGVNSQRLPLYMHEGLAKYLAEDWTGADAELLADAAAGGEILPLSRISDTFPTDERKRAIAYVQSYSVVEYMADRYSPQSILDLLANLESGDLYGAALRYSVGSDPDKFEAEWRQYLWEEYKLDRWLKFGSAFVSFTMAFLAVLAFRARIRQKRRKARELEEDGLD